MKSVFNNTDGKVIVGKTADMEDKSGAANGTVFFNMENNKVYMFDEDIKDWKDLEE